LSRNTGYTKLPADLEPIMKANRGISEPVA